MQLFPSTTKRAYILCWFWHTNQPQSQAPAMTSKDHHKYHSIDWSSGRQCHVLMQNPLHAHTLAVVEKKIAAEKDFLFFSESTRTIASEVISPTFCPLEKMVWFNLYGVDLSCQQIDQIIPSLQQLRSTERMPFSDVNGYRIEENSSPMSAFST